MSVLFWDQRLRLLLTAAQVRYLGDLIAPADLICQKCMGRGAPTYAQ